MEQQEMTFADKRSLANRLMDSFGVRDKRVIWSFLNHCKGPDIEADMEATLRTLRRDDKRTKWFW